MALALAVVAVLLGASAFGKVAGFYVQRGRLQGVLPAAPSERDPSRLKQCLGEARKTADLLKQKNLFVKTPPRQNPVKQVEGILGREALIGGRWYKVGDKIGEAKIVAIAATQVEVEWDGKKTTLSPIASTGSPSGPPAGMPPRREGGPPLPRPAVARMTKPAPAAPTGDDPFAWVGLKLSARARERLTQIWSSLPDEQKEKAKAEWSNMSDEDKQKRADALERM